ncbi:MAG: hypothetical protein ACLS36_02850 [Streptococcus sp.]
MTKSKKGDTIGGVVETVVGVSLLVLVLMSNGIPNLMLRLLKQLYPSMPSRV